MIDTADRPLSGNHGSDTIGNLGERVISSGIRDKYRLFYLYRSRSVLLINIIVRLTLHRYPRVMAQRTEFPQCKLPTERETVRHCKGIRRGSIRHSDNLLLII